MKLSTMNREELQDASSQLEQSLYNHQQWHVSLTRTLVCRLPADQRDLNSEAYKECRFGQWLYSQNAAYLHDHPGYIAIDEEHKRMHQLASEILRENVRTSVQTIAFDKYTNALERLRLEIAALQHEIENTLYNHDPLTGAMTRISMLPILREQQELVKRNVQPSCITMIDLDLFKKINDQYGHVVGDQVLIFIVKYLTKNMRSYDKLFRYGGEEFLLCQPNTDIKVAYEMIDRLRVGLAETDIDIGIKNPIRISMSCGVTSLDSILPVERSIEHADRALYAAKVNGRNITKIWDPSMGI